MASKPRQYYELRWFSLRNGAHAPRMTPLLEAWQAAATRAGTGPVGIFQPVIGEQGPSTLLLSTFSSAEAAAGSFDRLMADDAFAAAYKKAVAPEPPFTRMESSLLRAFAGFPEIRPPKKSANGTPHIFELRTYESDTMTSLRTKLEMFNSGEIGVFDRLGMQPVFFGESVFGRNQPSLTYMLAYDDLIARERLWKSFIADEEFTKLRNKPGYSDAEIVSTISSAILRPAASSTIR